MPSNGQDIEKTQKRPKNAKAKLSLVYYIKSSYRFRWSSLSHPEQEPVIIPAFVDPDE